MIHAYVQIADTCNYAMQPRMQAASQQLTLHARKPAHTRGRHEGADDDRRCMFFCRFVSISLTSVTPFTEMWFNTIHSEV